MQEIINIAMFLTIIGLGIAIFTYKEHKWISGLIILLLGLTLSVWLQADQTDNIKVMDKTTGTTILDYNVNSSLATTKENGIIYPTGLIMIITGLGISLYDITWRIFRQQ